MLSNLVNQLRDMDALHKIDEVYKELPKVRKDLGQIPLVTPTSQIVGIQTVNNVLFDDENERYKMITAQVKDLCYGLYGKTAVPINPEVQKKALEGYARGEEPITCRPAEVLEPEMEKAKEEIGDLAVDMDDLVLFNNAKQDLFRLQPKLEGFLSDRLHLSLKLEATFLNKASHGLSFLGMRIFPHFIRVKPENRRRSLRRLTPAR